MKFYRILFILFCLPFFAPDLKAQVQVPCRYPLYVSADSLVNFVKKDFEWRTGQPPQIDDEDWKLYFYDNSRGLKMDRAFRETQNYLLQRLGREVYCRYIEMMLTSFEINPDNRDEFYLNYWLQLPNLENRKKQTYVQFHYEAIKIRFTFHVQPDKSLKITYPTNVPECGGLPDCGFTITKEKALQIARANEIITNNVDYFIHT
ncbi:MAG TPA: hypothetical protein VK927_05025, partial [Adhaeribacter sp.]|nr:hypothetical protein [Adhaeribacter sp.]